MMEFMFSGRLQSSILLLVQSKITTSSTIEVCDFAEFFGTVLVLFGTVFTTNIRISEELGALLRVTFMCFLTQATMLLTGQGDEMRRQGEPVEPLYCYPLENGWIIRCAICW